MGFNGTEYVWQFNFLCIEDISYELWLKFKWKKQTNKKHLFPNVCITINTAKVIPKLKLKRQKMFSINMVKG